MNSNVTQTLAALRSAAEGEAENGWRDVYLDNAHADVAHLPIKTFRAALASLSKQGLYKVVDGYAWGRVKTEN